MTELIKTNIFGDGLIGGTSKIRLIPVQELPDAADAKRGAIYLLPAKDAEEGDLFEEYVVVEGKWEKFGQAKIDLEAFVTTVQEETMASGYDVKKKAVFYRDIVPLQSYRATLGAAHTFDFVEKTFEPDENFFEINIAHNGVLKGTYEAAPPEDSFRTLTGEIIETDTKAREVFGIPLVMMRMLTAKATRSFSLDTGSLRMLHTEAKYNLVAAINEVADKSVLIVQEEDLVNGYDATKKVEFYRNEVKLQSFRFTNYDFIESDFGSESKYTEIYITHNGVLKGTYEAHDKKEAFYSVSGEEVTDDAKAIEKFDAPLFLLKSMTTKAVRHFGLHTGVLAHLETEDKSTLVAAINELAAKIEQLKQQLS